MKYLRNLFEKPVLGQFAMASLGAVVPVLLWYYTAITLFPDASPSMIEVIGTWLTLVCVWLTGKQNLWCWPTGIISVILFAYSFYEYQLYASALLNAAYYFPVQFWGWYQWKNGRKVSWSQTNIERASILVGIGVGSLLWALFCTTYTDAQYAYVDSAIMGISIVAQWLLNYKRPEAWLLFIVVNVLSTWLYLTSGLYMIGALYAGFIFLASYGCYQWISTRKIAHA